MKITLLGDDLFSRTPFCKEVIEAGWDFVLVCKPSSHPFLYQWIEDLEKTKEGIAVVKKRRLKGKKYETEEYRFAKGLPLYETEALEVNWCEITIRNEQEKVTYKNSFITRKEVSNTTLNLSGRKVLALSL
jgi:hypothetical protein